MNPVVERRVDHDVTDVPSIVNGAVKLGLFECIMVLLISLVSHLLPNGVLQTALLAVLVVIGLAGVTLLPGRGTTKATTSSPHSGCGRPTTEHSATAGCRFSTSSISRG